MPTSQQSPIILIPSYRPDDHLVQTVDQLLSHCDFPIIIVDDGNQATEEQNLFNRLNHYPRVTVIHHVTNQGKGAALKTGIAYVREHFPQAIGVITADADGQHATQDILKVASQLQKQPDHLVLGSRDFNQENVPAKSAIGNKVTASLFKLMTGQTCHDTQTGLRGIPASDYPAALAIKGNRFDYEMNYLLSAAKRKVPFLPVSIQTIYRDNNNHSHYNPLKDSLKILSILFKFSLSSWVGAVVDMALFFLLIHVGLGQDSTGLILATVIARIASGFVNYYLNVNYVFKSQSNSTTFVKYLSLFTILLIFSAYGTAYLPAILGSHVLKKIVVDSLLFFASYALQKEFIFNQSQEVSL